MLNHHRRMLSAAKAEVSAPALSRWKNINQITE
jgi:hypothetical protein